MFYKNFKSNIIAPKFYINKVESKGLFGFIFFGAVGFSD